MHASPRPNGGTPLVIARARPPYDELEPHSLDRERTPPPLPLGTILCVRVRDVARDWAAVEACVPTLRARYPAAPVILHVAHAPNADAVHLARLAAFLSVRAILVDDEPIAPTLRRLMTRSPDLGAEVVEWLPLRGIRIAPECAPLVRDVVRLARAHRAVRDLLREIGESEPGARKRLRGRGLPAPSGWFCAARALHAALHLQGSRERTLHDVALDCGYSEHSTLSRQMVRVFGLRPSTVRELIGWEPLADRWVARAMQDGSRVDA